MLNEFHSNCGCDLELEHFCCQCMELLWGRRSQGGANESMEQERAGQPRPGGLCTGQGLQQVGGQGRSHEQMGALGLARTQAREMAFALSKGLAEH